VYYVTATVGQMEIERLVGGGGCVRVCVCVGGGGQDGRGGGVRAPRGPAMSKIDLGSDRSLRRALLPVVGMSRLAKVFD